jgi:hypothetical protein
MFCGSHGVLSNVMEPIGVGVSEFRIYRGFSTNGVDVEDGRTKKLCGQYQAMRARKEQPLAPGVKRIVVIEERGQFGR